VTDDEKIELHRKEYKTASNDELLKILHQYKEFSPLHIAAKQEIESRNRDFVVKQYEADKSTNSLTKIILVITIILLIVSCIQLAHLFGAFNSNNVVSMDSKSTVENANTRNHNNDAK